MLMLWKRQEVNFTRILPTWTDFLPPAANHVLSCQVNSPTASYDHQCRGVWKSIDVDRVCVCVFEEISSFDGLSQPPGAEPSTLKHIDSWAGDTGSVFGLSLLCPACHCVCVCV